MLQNTSTKPPIAILGGTGKEGPGLAMRWAGAGHPIIIGSRQLEKAQRIADELNASLNLDTISGLENGDAAQSADLCVLTVVQSAHRSALEGLTDDLQGKILVDATARVDFRDPRPPHPPSAARIAQDILGPDVRVVSAFQSVPAHVLRANLDRPLDLDVLVCADDLDAAEEVIELAEAGGMRAYYAGGLDNSIVVEGLTALLISLNKHYGVKTASVGVTGVPDL
jgi:NADPH-dependent F420 reductase